MTLKEAPSKTFNKVFQEAVDTGWRRFDQHYLLYASSGCFNLEHGMRRWLLPPQRAALIAADTEIRVWTSAPATSASILFSFQALTAPDPACLVFNCTTLTKEMIAHAMQWESDESDEEAGIFFKALGAVCRHDANTPALTWLPRASSKELSRALDYTLSRLDQTVGVEEVAKAAFLSRRTLARRCADELGCTWPQYLTRARMIRAAELLAQAKLNTEMIADAVGFSSSSAFIAAYKNFFGETPSQSKRQARDCA